MIEMSEEQKDIEEQKETNTSPGIPVPYHTTLYGQLEHHRLKWFNEPQNFYVNINLYNNSGFRGSLTIPVFGEVRIGEKYKVSITMERIEHAEFLIGVKKQLGV